MTKQNKNRNSLNFIFIYFNNNSFIQKKEKIYNIVISFRIYNKKKYSIYKNIKIIFLYLFHGLPLRNRAVIHIKLYLIK